MAPPFVPRRPRPPLTAREIATFFSGMRAAKAVGERELTTTEVESLALDCAVEDSLILQCFELSAYIYWFIRGFEMRQRLDRSSCP
jgi:hypothetical protein